MEELDAGSGPVEGTMSNPTAPEKLTEEQLHVNLLHLDPERTGPELWRECLETTMDNAVD